MKSFEKTCRYKAELMTYKPLFIACVVKTSLKLYCSTKQITSVIKVGVAHTYKNARFQIWVQINKVLSLWHQKATIVALIAVNKIIFFKNALWSHPLKPLYCPVWMAYCFVVFSKLLIIHIVSYLNTFYYPKCFPLQVFWSNI